jgi:opacity protein-like surface antigen
MKRFAIAFIVLACAAAFAADADVGTTTASFLKIGVGARAVGMGEAAAALAEGPDALYWNPAGLAAYDQPAVSFTHNEWLDDVRYEYIGLSSPLLNIGSFGFSAGYLGMGKLEGRDEQGNPTGEFSASDLLAQLGYGRAFGKWIAVGLAAEYISSKIDTDKATAVAGSLGLKANTPLPGLSAGAAVSNVGGEMKFDEEGDPLPMALRGGLAYRLPFGGENNKVTVAVDGLKYKDSDVYVNSGVEYWFHDIVAGRVGYKALYDSDGLTGGLGFKYAATQRLTLGADYAYADMGEDFGATHRISVGMLF